MKLIKGIPIRDKIKQELKRQIDERALKGALPPTLVIFQVGDDSASSIYIERKKQFGQEIGASVLVVRLPSTVTEKDLIKEVDVYNKDKTVSGIIVQMPLPAHISTRKVVNRIDTKKDVDGLTATNLGYLIAGGSQGFTPATTKGILTLLDEYQIPIEGKDVVVVGRSVLVGKSTAICLLNRNATVTICHSKTENLHEYTRKADIIIVATGQAGLIRSHHISRGQTIIDVGITVRDNKFYGDVNFDEVSSIVDAITPVPGGVGPMTVCSLFQNLVEAWSK